MGNNPVINIDPDGMFSIPWGAILSNVGTALSSVKQSFTSISLPFMTKTTQTYAPFANAGSALNMAGTILSMGMDAKAILDAAGEMGSAAQKAYVPSTTNSGIWINFVDNSLYPSEWFGHNSLSVGLNDAVWNGSVGDTWYYSAGGESMPRRNFTVEVPYRTPSGEWDPYFETYETPYEHGVMQTYMDQNRFVFSVEIPMPEGADCKAIVSHLVFTIQQFSKSFYADCDGLDGTCTNRVKELIVSSMVYSGLDEQASTTYVNMFLPGSVPPDDATWNIGSAKEKGYTRYRIFEPADGDYYWYVQGILNP